MSHTDLFMIVVGLSAMVIAGSLYDMSSALTRIANILHRIRINDHTKDADH